jgi:predicted glycoside hydrolase/deacetylase ChbG (UPF0249 family)
MVKVDEADIELRAQIDRAKQFGVPISHLDTHMGALFSRPDLLELYVKLGLEYNLPVLMVREVAPQIAQEYPALASRGLAVIGLLKSRQMPLLDRIGQFYEGNSYDERQQRYTDFLRDLPPGVSELIIHCGYDNEELRAITSSAARRDGDRRVFVDPATAALVKVLGIEVITWKQLREMQQQENQ